MVAMAISATLTTTDQARGSVKAGNVMLGMRSQGASITLANLTRPKGSETT